MLLKVIFYDFTHFVLYVVDSKSCILCLEKLYQKYHFRAIAICEMQLVEASQCVLHFVIYTKHKRKFL